MTVGDDESPPCLTFRRNPAQFVVVGSVPMRELESVNVLADEPIVKLHIGGRCKRSGGPGIPITS
jgi:hypothetical protein